MLPQDALRVVGLFLAQAALFLSCSVGDGAKPSERRQALSDRRLQPRQLCGYNHPLDGLAARPVRFLSHREVL